MEVSRPGVQRSSIRAAPEYHARVIGVFGVHLPLHESSIPSEFLCQHFTDLGGGVMKYIFAIQLVQLPNELSQPTERGLEGME